MYTYINIYGIYIVYIYIWCIYIYVYIVYIVYIGNRWYIYMYTVYMYGTYMVYIYICICMVYIYIFIYLFIYLFIYRIRNSIIDHQRWDYASSYTLFKQRICSGFGARKTSRKKLSIEGSTRKRIGRFTKNKFMAGHRILISDIFWYVLMMFFKFGLCSHYF